MQRKRRAGTHGRDRPECSSSGIAGANRGARIGPGPGWHGGDLLCYFHAMGGAPGASIVLERNQDQCERKA